jgi:hypothetical protein
MAKFVAHSNVHIIHGIPISSRPTDATALAPNPNTPSPWSNVILSDWPNAPLNVGGGLAARREKTHKKNTTIMHKVTTGPHEYPSAEWQQAER